MKYIVITLLLLFGFQLQADAQHHRKSHRARRHAHARNHHHRYHGRTFYRTHNVRTANTHPSPSPYNGESTPVNDGQRKNKQRNLNYNSGQPLPANNGR